ncbi:MAG TPA: class A beta-lactamase-related serine hydrolase [Candidatus Paceibacterota bacterium]|nr:class A beta-lactamase-related serine hydrolase [Candidatus Paceibacterota bacterium]
MLILIIGIFIGLFLNQNIHFSYIQKKYKYVAKRILIENPNDIIINFFELRKSLSTYIEKNNLDMGLFFQYITTGTTIGVNQDKPYVAASLLKLPNVIQVQKMIEAKEISGKDTITITSKWLDGNYGTLYKKGIGEKVTIDELMKISIQESDNTANNILTNDVIGGAPVNFYNSLDVSPEILEGTIAITPRNYLSILRSLFFAGYLSIEGSNKVLELMTGINKNDDDLGVKLPANIKIAQKIGVYEKNTDEKKYTYSDCGIFYLPKRPYMLCIMARGDHSTTSNHTREISKIIYDYVESANTYTDR